MTRAPQAAMAADLRPAIVAPAVAREFEWVFFDAMFQQSFIGIGADGPRDYRPDMSVWRSFPTEECAKAGDIGTADQLCRALTARQAARATAFRPVLSRPRVAP